MSGFEYVDLGAATILFVDDDPILREFAAVHLATDTATIEVAADGAEGYAMALWIRVALQCATLAWLLPMRQPRL